MIRPSVKFELMLSLNMGKTHSLTYSGVINAPGHELHNKILVKDITTKMGVNMQQTIRYWLEGDSTQEYSSLKEFAEKHKLN